MIIVWSGWGALVAVFLVVGFLIGMPVGHLISADENTTMAVGFVISGLLTGLGCFLLARKIEVGEGRAFIDERTQQRIVVKRSAGSFFFIPTRYWAYIAPVGGIVVACLVLFSPPAAPRSTAPAPTPASVSSPV